MEEVQRGWVKHPFRNMVVKAAKGGGYKIYCKFKKISCAKCEYGRANQRCIRKWCAKCCKKKKWNVRSINTALHKRGKQQQLQSSNETVCL